jgi:hypothetical protein
MTVPLLMAASVAIVVAAIVLSLPIPPLASFGLVASFAAAAIGGGVAPMIRFPTGKPLPFDPRRGRFRPWGRCGPACQAPASPGAFKIPKTLEILRAHSLWRLAGTNSHPGPSLVYGTLTAVSR